MSLLGLLNIGKSSLAAHQAALQVTGNNISNAGNANYTRQTVQLTPGPDQQLRPGIFLGSGVNLTGIERNIDEALMGRLRGSMSDSASADTTQQWLGRIEAVFNELGDDDLSTQLSRFFNAWSNLANNPADAGLRGVVLQTGSAVTTWMHNLRASLTSLQSDADKQLEAMCTSADTLASQVAELNRQITTAEAGGMGQSNGLRDQRDAVLGQLAQLIDVRTVSADNGIVNVYVGSEPLVMGTESRGVMLRQENVDGELVTRVAFKADGGVMQLNGGQLGAISQVRSGTLASAIDDLDVLAGNLIFEINKIHSEGQGLVGFQNVTGSVTLESTSAALNSADAGLQFAPVNGSFLIDLRRADTSKSLLSTSLVTVDLDGLGADDSLETLAAKIDALDGVSAMVLSGRLKISADSPEVEIVFREDSSHALAALGINGFFTGSDAQDIAVSQVLRDKPGLLAAAANGEAGDNTNAKRIAAMESQSVAALGTSLKDKYQQMINQLAVEAAGARTNAEAAQVVSQTLQSQREALSGVSLDEEAVNLMRYQRAFQGSARLLSAIDELMRTVLQLV